LGLFFTPGYHTGPGKYPYDINLLTITVLFFFFLNLDTILYVYRILGSNM